jgi:hypothetical protein
MKRKLNSIDGRTKTLIASLHKHKINSKINRRFKGNESDWE